MIASQIRRKGGKGNRDKLLQKNFQLSGPQRPLKPSQLYTQNNITTNNSNNTCTYHVHNKNKLYILYSWKESVLKLVGSSIA